MSLPAQNGRKSECPQGHTYDEANTYVRGGKRYCHKCQRAAFKRWRASRDVSKMQHGRVATYDAGCRCDPCRAAHAAKKRREKRS